MIESIASLFVMKEKASEQNIKTGNETKTIQYYDGIENGTKQQNK